MEIKLIPTTAMGNPLHPLPPDYLELSQEGQRQARINACRQWQIPVSQRFSPQAKAESAVASLKFLDMYYLRDDEADNFRAGFYDEEPAQNALFHEDISRNLILHQKVVCAAPRGSAKSTHARKETLLRLLTRNQFSVTYATSTNRLAKRCGDVLAVQFRYNKRIISDFGPECPSGRITPKRGENRFSSEFIQLGNLSTFFATSGESRNRGDRPLMFVLDDVEYDPDSKVGFDTLREGMEELLFRIVIPMMRQSTSLLWTGTKISRRHFLFSAFQTRSDSIDRVALQDPRFESWHQMNIRAEYPDPTEPTKRVSVWPAYWSLEWLDKRKAEIGPSNYLSEYMNEPGMADANYFILDERHRWWFENPDGSEMLHPAGSRTLLCWTRAGSVHKVPLNQFLLDARTFITVDSSYTNTPTSDYKAAALMACTSKNELFVLDCWANRCAEPELIRQVLEMSFRWRCAPIYVETVKETFGVYNTLKHVLDTKLEGIMQTHGFKPYVRPLRPGPQKKENRIAAMHFRFGDPSDPTSGGLIKFPTDWRTKPVWSMLFRQIEDFNPDADAGGLANDDLLDVVAAHQIALPGLPTTKPTELPPKTLQQRILEGELVDSRTGMPLISFMNFNELPGDFIQSMLTRHREPSPVPSLI